jgi:zinc-ribbon domain
MDQTTLRRCTACGSLVEAGANFCPECGTRQIDRDHRPEPVVAVAAVPDAPSAPVMMILAALAAAALLLALAVGLVIGRIGSALGGVASGGSDGDAAAAMDDYAPVAEGWQDKHERVADQGASDDSAGLAVAANDAGAWIDVNQGDLQAAAAAADSASAALYDQLLAIFDRRAEVLADIEAVATEGGTGLGAASDELGELAVLDQQAAAATCEIADVMRAEGDDPADHITPGMHVTCA